MKVFKHIIYLTLGLFSFFACNPQSEASSLLKQAQGIIEDYPDSALVLIDSIFYPEKSLNKRQYMEYLVLQAQARRKTQIPIKDDTLIFKAIDYFSNKDKDIRFASLASFYGGSVYREQNDYEKAMQLYKDAEYLSQKTNDVDLQGLVQYNIGDLFAEQDIYNKALEHYQLAENLYAQSPKNPEEKRATCLSATGRMYALLNNMDSSIHYLQKGLNFAVNAKNHKTESLLAQNLGVIYSRLKQYELAKDYLKRSFLLDNDSTELTRYFLNFAKLYSETEHSDSVYHYVNMLEQSINASEDLYLKASAYNFLSEWEKKHGNYDKVFFYKDEHAKTVAQILKKSTAQSVYDAQQKYDFEKLQNKYNQQFIGYQRWIILFLIVILFAGVLFFIYLSKQKNKKIQVLQKIDTLREMNRDLESIIQQKNLDLRKDLLWRFNVTNKVINLNQQMTSSSKFKLMNSELLDNINKILYENQSIDERWDAMFHTFNTARPGFSAQLREKYPSLSESEFQICILTYAGLRVKEIALILGLSANTVQTRRTLLRQKIGLKPGANIIDYLDKEIVQYK